MEKITKYMLFILCPIFFVFIGIVYIAIKINSIIIEKQKNLEKNQKMFSIINIWIQKKQQGKSIVNFLKKNNYCSVAVYGLGNIGKLLEEELKGEIEIRYGVDRRKILAEFPVYKPEDDLPEADVMIVTTVYEFEEIEEMLKKKLTCSIYSIEDIIYFMA